ncbi:DUF4190 domain-containing protein [Micromonospora sp. NPDC049559]|uniref:DUF4190 domain-containing protein n=1 Tax=Micromonospora sp. NPDC049559 TaxID=3155923 RepID=UPI00341A61FB
MRPAAPYAPVAQPSGYPVPGASPLPGASPASGMPPGGGLPAAVPPPPPRDSRQAPRRVEAVPGTHFALVHLDVPPVTSGLAIGSLVVGIASILVAVLVACFGVAGPSAGWVAGAFAVLGGLASAAAIVLGLLGLRQIRRVGPPPAIRFTGRGLAIAGLACGGAGLVATVLAFAISLLLHLD